MVKTCIKEMSLKTEEHVTPEELFSKVSKESSKVISPTTKASVMLEM